MGGVMCSMHVHPCNISAVGFCDDALDFREVVQSHMRATSSTVRFYMLHRFAGNPLALLPFHQP